VHAPADTLPFSAEHVDPVTFFDGTLLLTVPHQDDGVLACGAALAQLRHKTAVHVVYATDGSGSPAPVLPWRDAVPVGLDRIRMEEAREAMEHLGVPDGNVHFLAYPDGRLRRHLPELRRSLRTLAERIRPDHVLVPFRYDRHSDHLALNRAVLDALAAGELGRASVTEYFVYHQWRLLPRGDVRTYVRPGMLRQVSPGEAGRLKREALDRFRSQTTCYFLWQTRPNLTPALLDDVSRSPEVFLPYDAAWPGARIFRGPTVWIRAVHRLEPSLKKRKDQLLALLTRGARGKTGPTPSKTS
jgi:LmbE family N-acetylglucosaminyl deacetylase